MTFSSPSYVKPVSKRTLNKVRSRHRLKVGPKHVSWAGQDLIIERRTQYRGPKKQNRVLGHYTINIIRGSPKIVKVLLIFRPLYYGSNDLEPRPRICARLRTFRQTLDSKPPGNISVTVKTMPKRYVPQLQPGCSTTQFGPCHKGSMYANNICFGLQVLSVYWALKLPGRKSINFHFIMVPVRKSIKVWYSKAQYRELWS